MIFITGSTGFLGRELLRSLSHGDRVSHFCLLIRANSQEEAAARADRLIPANLRHRVEIINGDITLPHYGLSPQIYANVAARVRKIYHCAASTQLAPSLSEARAINVVGTSNALALAIAALPFSFEMFYHISTAFVAGDTELTVSPDYLDLNVSFRNAYEQSKAEAELLVRESGVPYCIFRPSVIVGNSITGATSAFNVLYVPARLLVTGIFRALPVSHHTTFDVVPVDYVAEAIAALSHHQQRTSCSYHLCAGLGREPSPWEIVEALIDTFNKYRERGFKILHPPKLLSPEMLSWVYHSICVAKTGVRNLEKLFTQHIEILRQVLPFFPYMIRNPRFDTQRTERDLSGILSPPPLFKDYAENVFKYCLDTNWGREVSATQ